MSNCLGPKKGKKREKKGLHTKDSDFLTALNVMLGVVEVRPEVIIGAAFSFYQGPVNVISRNVILSVYVKCSYLCLHAIHMVH